MYPCLAGIAAVKILRSVWRNLVVMVMSGVIEDQVLPPNATGIVGLSIDLTFQLHNLLRGIGRL